MSRARSGVDDSKQENAGRALQLLEEAQTVIDTLDRPDIGARLQEVIDAMRDLPKD